MNAAVTEDGADMGTIGPGPGERLRSARLAQGLEVSDVAKKLSLTEAMVKLLEQDAYDQLPSRVFVSGYFRNYARLLNVTEDSIMEIFEQRCPGEKCSDHLARVHKNVKTDYNKNNNGLIRLIIWLLILGVLGLLIYRGMDYLQLEDKVNPLESLFSTKQDAAESSPDLLLKKPLPSQGGSLMLDIPASRTEEETEAAMNPPVSVTESEIPVNQSEISLAPMPAVETETNQVVSQSPMQTEDMMAVAPQPAIAQEPVEAAVPVSETVLDFTDDCWVDVRDSTRKYKLFGRIPKGSRKVLGGVSPYKVVLGNYKAVKLTVNGKPYDLAAHASGSVARFTLATDDQ